VLFLLMTIATTIVLVRFCSEAGWLEIISSRSGRKFFLSSLLSSFCLATFTLAGRSFFIRKARQGGRFLLASLIGFGLLAAVLFLVPWL